LGRIDKNHEAHEGKFGGKEGGAAPRGKGAAQGKGGEGGYDEKTSPSIEKKQKR